MNLADKTLTALQKKETLVDVFTDYFDESHYGFIRNFNDDFLLLEHYNDNATPNGIIIYRRQDITRLRWDNNDIISTSVLITGQDQKPDFAGINIDNMQNILNSVEKRYEHVALSLQNLDKNWTIIGQIAEIDNETLVIKEFGTKATLDRGMLMISISDITRIDAGGIYENSLLKIYQPGKLPNK